MLRLLSKSKMQNMLYLYHFFLSTSCGVNCITHQKGLYLKVIIRIESDFTHAKKKSVMLIRARSIDNSTRVPFME